MVSMEKLSEEIPRIIPSDEPSEEFPHLPKNWALLLAQSYFDDRLEDIKKIVELLKDPE